MDTSLCLCVAHIDGGLRKRHIECILSHMSLSHVTHMNASCHAYGYVTVSVCRTHRWRFRKKAHRHPQQMRWQPQQLQHVSSVLQCVAVWCSVVQCVAVCCSVLQYMQLMCIGQTYWQSHASSALQCAAIRCSVCCSVLQCVAVHRSVRN